jgi:tRNA (adenine57-N1/adenine58-N1)-methyltransferase
MDRSLESSPQPTSTAPSASPVDLPTPSEAEPAPTGSPDVPAEAWSGVHRGPLRAGEWVRLVDSKGRRHNICLTAGKRFFSNRGHFDHDELIGREEGFTIDSSAGGQYLVFRPLLSEFVVSMPRGAAVVYPKDAAQIIAMVDIYPGARVVEAGVGSGALTCSLLRAVGPYGRVSSYERREEFAEVARQNVNQFFGAPDGQSHPAWELTIGDLVEQLPERGERADRIILDMLAPWECVDVAADALEPGGILCAYVATTTQLSRFVETVRAHGGFTEPQQWESMVREWHVEGLAVRPGHKMIGHTAFLVTARRMAPGQKAPRKGRRPAPGAYGIDYTGPRPADLPPQLEQEAFDA